MMGADTPCILTINPGSTSIKIAIYEWKEMPAPFLEAIINNIGTTEASLSISCKDPTYNQVHPIEVKNHDTAAKILVDKLKQLGFSQNIKVIGHRIVHGGPKYFKPSLIDNQVLEDMSNLLLLDPIHIPMELELIKSFQDLFPNVLQVASFDTSFHHHLPTVAQTLALPRHYESIGLRRYGFHGLSCSYIMTALKNLVGEERANGRIIIAHLGGGVSLTAIRDGKSVDTTMGLTPNSGVPMATRSGDIDSGLPLLLSQLDKIDFEEFNDLVNFQSGLLGVSETTADMKQLVENQNNDPRAKQAVDFFCYQIKKAIGSLSATLDGIDILVFTGGIGENSAIIRDKICTNLTFLGIQLDHSNNRSNQRVISDVSSHTQVRVIHTIESSIIAKDAWQLTRTLEN
ncbi:MAG TPA: acetate/propionate family kinase [Candidatus Saccharimonadales bacterium]|jgi:acetate kinase|nr:acetate/propionate family kinase [Candidatus Saccharimonadales bacterium]